MKYLIALCACLIVSGVCQAEDAQKWEMKWVCCRGGKKNNPNDQQKFDQALAVNCDCSGDSCDEDDDSCKCN